MNLERPASKQPIPSHAKKVFEGVMFDVYQWEQKMFDGTVATFEKIRRPDTVVVFPVLPDGKIVLTEQVQPGTEHFIGATGGRIDKGEDVLTAAKRELLEESGYEADEFVLWDKQQVSSKIDWAVYTFIAKGVRKVSDLHLDPGEKIKLKPVTLDELIDLSMDSKFSEKEVMKELMMAKFDPIKKKELQELFRVS